MDLHGKRRRVRWRSRRKTNDFLILVLWVCTWRFLGLLAADWGKEAGQRGDSAGEERGDGDETFGTLL